MGMRRIFWAWWADVCLNRAARLAFLAQRWRNRFCAANTKASRT